MGNTQSAMPLDMQDVLINSFTLDNHFDICYIPVIRPGKQAMFHPPSTLSDHLSHFISREEITKVMTDLNEILKATAFNMNPPNPLFVIFIVIGITFPFITLAFNGHSPAMGSAAVPFLFAALFFGVFFYLRNKREKTLQGYISTWNSDHATSGVKLTIGGVVTHRRLREAGGTQQGGNYFHFYYATWDRNSIMATGYLNIFVNSTQRQLWCSQQGVQFVMPLVVSQQTNFPPQGPVIAGSNPPPAPGNFQAPPGFVLVPQSQVQVLPPGQALVPQGQVQPQAFQDLPPSYEESKSVDKEYGNL